MTTSLRNRGGASALTAISRAPVYVLCALHGQLPHRGPSVAGAEALCRVQRTLWPIYRRVRHSQFAWFGATLTLTGHILRVVQRAAVESGGLISHDALSARFKETYGYDSPPGRLSLKFFELDRAEGGTRLTGELVLEDKVEHVKGVGNGPSSALLACLHQVVDGSLVREYSEHALGQGTAVGAATYVELVHEVAVGERVRKTAGWGVVSDTDIAASGLHAVMSAASRVGVVLKTQA